MRVKRSWKLFTAKPMAFGEWQVTEFKQKGFPQRTKRTTDIGGVSYSKIDGSAAYRFVMAPGAREPWECRCQHRLRQRSIGLGANDQPLEFDVAYTESLECDLQRAGDDAVWKLHIDGSLAFGGVGYIGTLAHDSRSLSLHAVHEIEGVGPLPGPPTGYLFERDSDEIASAEMLRPGYVRIGAEAGEDRDLIATAMAALLLQPEAH